MKKKDSAEAREFWARAEEISREAASWPEWKRQFGIGYSTGASDAPAPEASNRRRPNPKGE